MELGNVAVETSEKCMKLRVPIRGRQLIKIIQAFYQIDKEKHIQYDLYALTTMEFISLRDSADPFTSV